MPFPNPYFQGNFSPYPQIMQPQPYQPSVPQTVQQTQNSSFIHVQSETQAREWQVAPGGSVTFINDNAPYCYTKSLGLSQFDSPVFKRFRLVEESDVPQNVQNTPETALQSQGIDLSAYVSKAEFEPICALISGIKAELETIRKDLYSDEQSSDK